MKLRDTVLSRRLPDIALVIMIALAIIAINSIIIAAPGFFSHDEWQRFEDVAANGLRDYARRFSQLKVGHDFGSPFRPIGFLEEGFTTQWMVRLPFIPHLIDVLLHTLITLLLFITLRRVPLCRRTAAFAAILFGASPLTIMATGWVAASFDLWYTLFILTACLITVQICRAGAAPWRIALLAGACAGAILSKETGIAAPAAVGLTAYACFLANHTKVEWRKLGLCITTSATVVILYLLYRLPALQQSFAGTPSAAYTPGAGNLLRNLVSYLAYPFVTGIAEIVNFPAVSRLGAFLALSAHALLLICIARRFGIRAGCLYVAGYLTFLLPVLSLPSGGSHYLYACAIPMGIALGALLHREWLHRNRLQLAVLAAIVGVLAIHTVRNQVFIYSTALCQSRFIDSLDTRLAAEALGGTQALLIRPDPDAPAYVGIRAIHGSARYSGRSGPAVFMDPAQAEQAGAQYATAVMTRQCTIR